MNILMEIYLKQRWMEKKPYYEYAYEQLDELPQELLYEYFEYRNGHIHGSLYKHLNEEINEQDGHSYVH